MKKHKKKYGLIVWILVLSLVLLPNEAMAKKKGNATSKGKANGNPDAADEACKSSLLPSDGLFTVQMKKNDDYVFTYTANEGQWQIAYYVKQIDEFDYEDVDDNATVVNYTAGDKEHSITVSRGDTPQRIVLMASLKGHDVTENKKTKHVAYDKTGNADLKVTYSVPDPNDSTKTINKEGTCQYTYDKITINDDEDTSKWYNISGTGAVMKMDIPAKSTKIDRGLCAPGTEDTEECRNKSSECEMMKNAQTIDSNGLKVDYYKPKNDTEEAKKEAEDKKIEYAKKMANTFKICFDGSFHSSFDISAQTIKHVREKSLEAFGRLYEYNKNLEENTVTKYNEVMDEIKTEGDWLEGVFNDKNKATVAKKDKSSLKCDVNQEQEKTTKLYVEKINTKPSMCNITCVEQAKVTFDPPRALKVSGCFPYKATIKSKVTCKVEKKGNPDDLWPNWPNGCGFSPICNNKEQETQAGPSQEFDKCINSCDNGKYTQSCINSCYKKVYKNTKTEKNNSNNTKKSTSVKKVSNTTNYDDVVLDLNANNSNDTRVIKLSNSDDPFYKDDRCNTNDKIIANVEYCSKIFYVLKQKCPMGEYKERKKQGKHTWITHQWAPCYDDSSKDYCCGSTVEKSSQKPKAGLCGEDNQANENVVEAVKRASPYYFRTQQVSKETLLDLYGARFWSSKHNCRRRYSIDSVNVHGDDGIKRQTTIKFTCPEYCGYAADDDNDVCLNSNKAIREYFDAAFDKVLTELEPCTASSSCKNGEANFKLEAENSEKGKYDYYSGKNKSSKNESCEPQYPKMAKYKEKESAMVLAGKEITNKEYSELALKNFFVPLVADKENQPYNFADCKYRSNGINGKCYGKLGGNTNDTKANYWHHYKTTISFPGVYVGYKSGIYDRKEEYNYFKEGQYCTTPGFKPVNQAWWATRVRSACPEGEVLKNAGGANVINDHNIKANIKNFGKYNWNLDISCFYGISNYTCVTEDPECNTPDCYEREHIEEEKDTKTGTQIFNMVFRPIDSSNLFPAKGANGNNSGSKLSETEVPFNWQPKAKDNMLGEGTSAGYEKDPWEYKKEIEATGEKSYDKKAEYIINLSKANINKIKEYTKTHGYNLDKDQNLKGSYNEMKNVPGGHYYESKFLKDTNFVKTTKSSFVKLGENNSEG